MTSSRGDREVVRGYLAGKTKAVHLVDGYIARAFNRWRGRFGFEADDILSDCRYKLYISLQRNDFSFDSSLSTYINSIVNHTCVDYLRFRKRVTAVDLDDVDLVDGQETADHKLDRLEAGRMIFRILRMVPRECLKLWQMVIKKRLKYSEIAETVGKTENNVKRRMWECRDLARRYRDVLEKKANLSELSSPLK